MSPPCRLIGAMGEGFKIAMHVLELFRPTVGAAALGFARRAMSESIERSVSRTTFKKPISEHQMIQAKLADMAVGHRRRFALLGVPRRLATRCHGAKHLARSRDRQTLLDRDGLRHHR